MMMMMIMIMIMMMMMMMMMINQSFENDVSMIDAPSYSMMMIKQWI